MTKESVKGPGTLATRIAKLRERLKEGLVQRAEALLQKEDYDTIQLAWYMASLRRIEQQKRKRIEKAQRVLQELAAKDTTTRQLLKATEAASPPATGGRRHTR